MAEKKLSRARNARQHVPPGATQAAPVQDAVSVPLSDASANVIAAPASRNEALGCLRLGQVRLALWAGANPDDVVINDLAFIVNELLIGVHVVDSSENSMWSAKLARFRAVADDVADVDNRYASDLGEFVRVIDLVRGLELTTHARLRMFFDVARGFGATKTPVLDGLSTAEAEALVGPLLESSRSASAVVAKLVHAAIARGHRIGPHWSSKTTLRALDKAIDNHRRKRQERRTSA